MTRWIVSGGSAGGARLQRLWAGITAAVVVASAGVQVATTRATSAVSNAPGITLPATQDPTQGTPVDTGLDVTQGETVNYSAGGAGQYGYDACVNGNIDTVTTDANGYRTNSSGVPCDLQTKTDPAAVDPTAPIGSVIGRIGTSPWFFIGSGGQIPATASGRLYLAYNDDGGYYTDNGGSFIVDVNFTITVPGTAGGDGTVNASGFANVAGVATGLTVSSGETIGIQADGYATYGTEGQAGCSGQAYTDPSGNRMVGGTPCTPAQKFVTPTDPTIPVPDAPIGALIGEIGSGPWFLIGGETTFVASASGPLSLGYNDNYAADNSGQFYATLVPGNLNPTTNTGGGGGPVTGGGAVVGAPPVESSATWRFADSTGAHGLDIQGTGLSAVTDLVYGLTSSATPPPPCGEIQGVLAPVSGACTYAVPATEHISDSELKPTAPPGADLAHITMLSPWGRSDTFAVSNAPVQPVLTGAAVSMFRDPGTGAAAYPTAVELFGTGLSQISNITYGVIPFPQAPLPCPVDSTSGVPTYAGEPCSFVITAADVSNGVVSLSDTRVEALVPVGADLSHITVFGPGGGSNSVSIANVPGAPVVTSASAAIGGNTAGQLNVSGSNLTGITTVLLGDPTPGQMPGVCPYNSGGWMNIVDNIPCVMRPDDAFVNDDGGSSYMYLQLPGGVLGPNGSLGNLAHIVLLSPHGESNVFQAQVPPAPTLTGVAPYGTAADGRPELVFTGTNLTDVTSVDIGSQPSPSFRSVGDTQVVAELPPGTGSVQAQVATLGGPSNALTITYPAFGSYSYSSATAPTGNAYIDITGSGLTNPSGAAPEVFFGTTPSPDVSVVSGGLHVEVPNHSPGDPTSEYVVVRTQSGDTPDVGSCPGTGPDCFAYPAPGAAHFWPGEFGPPQLSGLSPAHVSAASPSTVLSGSGFLGATAVQVGSTQLALCPSASGCYTVVNDGQISLTAPSLSPGSYPVTVTNPSGTSGPLTLIFNPPPGLTGASTVTPVSGPPAAGGPATSATSLPGNGFKMGPFTATGTWTQSGAVFTATGTVTLNGFLIVPDTGASIAFDCNALTLTTTGQVTVSLAPVNVPVLGKVGPFVLYHGQVSWTLSAATVLGDLSNINLGGLPIKSLAINWPSSNSSGTGGSGGTSSGGGTTSAPDGGAALAAVMQLPGILGGKPLNLNIGTTSIGVDPSTLNPCIGQVALGALVTVSNACLDYNPSQNSWFLSGNAQAAGGTQITGSLAFANGAVSQGTIVAQSTSLAGLVGVTGFQIDYSGASGSEEWQGQATDTGGNQSNFDFKFTNGSLTSGVANVPKASIGGLVTITNLNFNYQNGNWSLSSDAAVSGIANVSGSMTVQNGAVTSAQINVNSPALGALVNIPSFTLSYDGSQPGTDSWAAQATDNQGNVDSVAFTTVNGVLTSGSLQIPQASIAGVVTISNVLVTYDTGHWHGQATASLPGGSGGSVIVDVTYDPSGQLAAAHFELYNASLAGAITVNDLKVDYAADSQTYAGALDAVLPGAGVAVGGSVVFAHGAFQGASLTVNVTSSFVPGAPPGIPIGGVLYLRKGTLALSLNPLVVSGGITVGIGPQVNGVDLLSGDATLTYSAANGSNPSDWHLGVDLNVLDKYTLANATVDLRNGNELKWDVNLQLPPGGHTWNGIQFGADLSGWVTPNGFSAYAATNVAIGSWKPSVAILANNQAIEACANTGVLNIKAGFQYKWSGQFNVWAPSCDITKPTAPFVRRMVRLAPSVLAPQNPSFTAAAGQQALSFSVGGQGGLSSFTVTDPNGATLDIPASTPSGSILTLGQSQVFVLEDVPDAMTDVLIGNPVAGTYTTTPDSGSLPVTAGVQYTVVPDPTVTATVTGTGGAETLSWTASNLNGDSVNFMQGGDQATTSSILTTTQPSGSAPFAPSDGPAGTRTVTAVITDPQGAPVAQTQVATFAAPAPTIPGAPGSLGLAGSVLSWQPPTSDGGSAINGYAVYAGTKLVALSPSGELSTDVGNLPTGTPLTVVAVNAVGNGPASAPLAFGATGFQAPPTTGGSASSDPPGTTPGPNNPEVVTVSSPATGPIQISKTGSPGTAPPGYLPLGVGATITAPPGSDTHPLSVTFAVAVGSLPKGIDPQQITVTRDGTVAPLCPPGATTSDLCVQSVTVSGGVLTVTVLSAHASSWQVVASNVDRIAGPDRVGTAVAVSGQEFPGGGAGGAVIARADDYADALAGGPLAAAKHDPLLVTPTSSLDPRVLTELQRVAAPGSTVYLLGGTGALSQAVADAVTTAGYQVVRLAGNDRYATAVAVADALGDPATVFLARGDSFADALPASDAAVGRGAVLLTSGSTVPGPTAGYLATHQPANVYAVGGPAAAAVGSVATAAFVGADRYATAVSVAERFFPSASSVGLASGVNFPDALAAAPALGVNGEPLLLTDPAALPASVGSYLASAGITQVHVFGGQAAVGFTPSLSSQTRSTQPRPALAVRGTRSAV